MAPYPQGDLFLREVRIARYYDALRVLPFFAAAIMLSPLIDALSIGLAMAQPAMRYGLIFGIWGALILGLAMINRGLVRRLAERPT